MPRRRSKINDENKPISFSKRDNDPEPKDGKGEKNAQPLGPQSTPKSKSLSNIKKDVYNRKVVVEKGWRPNQAIKREAPSPGGADSRSSMFRTTSHDSLVDHIMNDMTKCHSLKSDQIKTEITAEVYESNIKSESENRVFKKSKTEIEEKRPNQTVDVCTSSKSTFDIISGLAPEEDVDQDALDVLMELGGNFVDETVRFAAKLAQLRKDSAISVSDVGLALDRRWNMQFPEFSTGITKKKTKLAANLL